MNAPTHSGCSRRLRNTRLGSKKIPVTFCRNESGSSFWGTTGSGMKLRPKMSKPTKQNAIAVNHPSGLNFVKEPTRNSNPNTKKPIAKGHKQVGRGAFGSVGGVGGGEIGRASCRGRV